MLHRVRRLFDIYAAYHLPQDTPHPGRDRLRLIPGFAAAGLRALPDALRWARLRDPAARARVKQILDLSGPAPVELDESLFRAPPQVTPPEGASVTLVLPVYNALPLAREAPRRVAPRNDIPCRSGTVD